MLVGAVNLCFGLLFQALVAASYGAGGSLDAFFMAYALPGFLNNWLLWGAANIVLVPLLCSREWTSNPDESQRVADTFITALGLMGLLVSAACLLAAHAVVPLIAPGFDPEQARLTARILQVICPTVFLTAVVAVVRGILNAHSIFLGPYAFLTLYHLFQIAFVLAFRGPMGIWALAAGTGLASVLLCILHLFPMRRVRFRYRPRLERALLRGPLGVFFAYMLVGVAAQINFVADRYFASRLAEGSITILSLAQKFQIPIIFLFTFAVTVPALTILSGSLENRQRFRTNLRTSLRHLTVLVVPFMALLLALRTPLAQLWLQHGVFSAENVRMVGLVILGLSAAFLVNAYSSLLVNGYFVLKRTGLVIVVVFAECGLNIFLNWLLVGPFGLLGIALATSLSTAPVNILLWVMLRRRLGGLGFRDRAETLRLVLWCACCYPVVLLATNLAVTMGAGPDRGPLMAVFGVTALSLPAILLLGLALRIEEIQSVAQLLTRPFRIRSRQ